MTRYWKVLDADGRATHGGIYQYDLPKDGKAGQWTPRIKDIAPCKRGYHLCRDADLVRWCNGKTIWLAEARGVIVTADNKVVAESIRIVSPTPWDATTARLFAVECAADVLHLNDNPRVANCLEVTYRFALGDATDTELVAARDAAGAAARYAAGAVAGAAAWYAAWNAAGGAARDAAGYAARYAARDAQTARLLWWIGASDTYPQGDV